MKPGREGGVRTAKPGKKVTPAGAAPVKAPRRAAQTSNAQPLNAQPLNAMALPVQPLNVQTPARTRSAPAPAGPDWKDWQHTRADLETDSTAVQEKVPCPQCRAEYARQDVQAAFDFTFEGLDEYPQHWRRSWVRCQQCGHQYLVDDERSAAGQ